MSLVIRPADMGDAPGVLSLWHEADAEPTHTDNLASIATLISHDPGALIVAEDTRRIVGSIIAGWDGWRGSVYRLAVAPDSRRRGLGNRLLEAAEDRLAALGAQRLQATVVETDERATGFWRASGWEQQADRLRFVKG
jgi:ribosomal protein S18 acetylase RimI-like enzyme